jgi:ribonuclease HI
VRGNEVVAEGSGADADTTNNRMELTAVLRALEALPLDAETVIHADSELVVKTFTLWAAGWKRAGWKRKTGAIANLDLVKAVDGLLEERPAVKFQWVPAHAGWRWNEYVDALVGSELPPR